MGRRSKISEQDWTQIAERVRLGATREEISREYAARGVTISPQAIGQYLSARRTARADAAKTVARGETARSLPADIAALDEHLTTLREIVADARKRGDDSIAVRALREARETIRLRVEVSGALQPDTTAGAFVTTVADLLAAGFEE